MLEKRISLYVEFRKTIEDVPYITLNADGYRLERV